MYSREVRVTAQPQTEPYAEPVPQYKINQQQPQLNRHNGMILPSFSLQW